MSEETDEARKVPGWAWLRARTSVGDRVVYGIVLALVLAALVGQPIMGALSPGRAMGGRFIAGDPTGDLESYTESLVDPWGRQYVGSHASKWGSYVDTVRDGPMRSLGPNGVDEQGRGDDVLVVLDLGAPIYAAWLEILLLLAGLCAGSWELRRLLRTQLAASRAETLGPEVVRAAWLAVFLAVFLGACGYLGLQVAHDHAPQILQAVEEQLLVPVWLAVCGLSYLFAFGFFLWLRLRAAAALPEDVGPSEQVGGS